MTFCANSREQTSNKTNKPQAHPTQVGKCGEMQHALDQQRRNLSSNGKEPIEASYVQAPRNIKRCSVDSGKPVGNTPHLRTKRAHGSERALGLNQTNLLDEGGNLRLDLVVQLKVNVKVKVDPKKSMGVQQGGHDTKDTGAQLGMFTLTKKKKQQSLTAG